MTNKGKIKFDTVWLIDESPSEMVTTEQMLLIGADVKHVHKENNPHTAIQLLNSIQNPQELPEFIFLDVRNQSSAGFFFLEEYGKLSESIRSRCQVVLLSIYFKFRTELNHKIRNYPFVRSLITKPLDMRQLYTLKAAS